MSHSRPVGLEPLSSFLDKARLGPHSQGAEAAVGQLGPRIRTPAGLEEKPPVVPHEEELPGFTSAPENMLEAWVPTWSGAQAPVFSTNAQVSQCTASFENHPTSPTHTPDE